MSKKYLGDTIDIHAGGRDLIFPHHENEIAQSEARNDKPFANYWMHNGYITVNDEKMSKSKENFFTVRDILRDYDGETVRFFLLSGHYRSPINFNRELMEQAKNSLARIRNARATLRHLSSAGSEASPEEENGEYETIAGFREKFVSAMDDDLNTADAISAVFEMISAVNSAVRGGASKSFAKKCLDLLEELTGVLGLLSDREDSGTDDVLRELIDERQAAREAKDFARADAIRDELKARGVTLKDTPQGVQIIRE
jgi:cysteinyl-tRNA synthetase